MKILYREISSCQHCPFCTYVNDYRDAPHYKCTELENVIVYESTIRVYTGKCWEWVFPSIPDWCGLDNSGQSHTTDMEMNEKKN